MDIIGHNISHYKITERLAFGGMGVVYKAEDTKLKRTVALKLLPPELTSDPEAKERLVHEAQAASTLQHHNICTIHEIGETDDGVVFICMDYYEGETLKKKLSGLKTKHPSPMPIEQILDISIQTAQGLVKAHDKGIIHRDIKPANIMITNDGVVKILDFGLAKYLGSRQITQSGKAMGTLAYLSPEQAAGKKVDHRTDIWSLGVVLYEMATAKLPFEHDYDAAVVYSIMDKPPVPPSKTGVPVSEDLEYVILKCLQKNPSDRYQTAQTLISDLNKIRKESVHEKGDASAVKREQFPKNHILGRMISKKGRTFIVAGLSLLLILGLAMIPAHFLKKVKKIKSLAVLPLENLSSDKEQEFFVSGIHEELLTDLSKIKALRVISKTSVMRYEKTKKSASEIAKELNVDALVEGSVMRAEGQVRINVQLIDGSTDKHLWAESYNRDMRNMLMMLSEVTQAIAGEIKIAVTRQEKDIITAAHFIKPEVHEEYLRGRYLFNQFAYEKRQEALTHFQRSTEMDPNFAPGYAGQASVYFTMGLFGMKPYPEVILKARTLAMKSLEMDEGLGDAHSVLGWIKLCYDWNWPDAAKELQRALELNPNDAIARHAYGDYLTIMGHPEEGLQQVILAKTCDPFSPIAVIPAIFHLQFVHRYDEMIVESRKLLTADPEYPAARSNMRDALWLKGDHEKAFIEYQKTWAWDGKLLEALNRGYRKAGPKGALRELADAYSGQFRPQTGSTLSIAELYALAGEKDKALAWLEKAYQERAPFLVHLQASPMYDSLRWDKRFQSLLKRIGFPMAEKERPNG